MNIDIFKYLLYHWYQRQSIALYLDGLPYINKLKRVLVRWGQTLNQPRFKHPVFFVLYYAFIVWQIIPPRPPIIWIHGSIKFRDSFSGMMVSSGVS